MTRAIRWLYLTHRYLGIALCVPMLAWCLSGMVMVYVSYPSLKESARLSHLAPIEWNGCCTIANEALPDDAPVPSFQVEMLNGRPVLRLRTATIDLTDGKKIQGIPARPVAEAFGTVEAIEQIDYDQWTVSGGFNRDRPLYLARLAGPEGRQVYVSSTTGKAVQVTDRQQRLWNWLGAVPHWFYFTGLRHDVTLWTQIVIWTSLIGGFLTFTGGWIGIRQLLRAPAGRWSPHKGWKYWHHLPGLIFGLFALTWVISGMFSMNPWGTLEGGDSAAERASLHGVELTGAMVKQALRDLPHPPGIVAITAAQFDGALAFLATSAEGRRWRLDGLPSVSLDRAAALLGAQTAELLDHEDAYYFAHHHEALRLPVYRLLTEDGRRFYLDPLSGEMLASIDGADRGYRWIYEAPHRLDFAPWLRERPVRDMVMLTLLAGVTLSFATGLYLAIRWLRRKLP